MDAFDSLVYYHNDMLIVSHQYAISPLRMLFILASLITEGICCWKLNGLMFYHHFYIIKIIPSEKTKKWVFIPARSCLLTWIFSQMIYCLLIK